MISIPRRVGFLQDEALFLNKDVGYSFSSPGVLLQFCIRRRELENEIEY